MKNNQQENYFFSNPVCKDTYNSLPKIYGHNKSNRSIKQGKKNSSTQRSRHVNCISSAEQIMSEKKLLCRRKHCHVKSRYLSLPKPEICNKKNCQCRLVHQQQLKAKQKQKSKSKLTISPKKKVKLRPLQFGSPDDFQSEHKVAMRIQTEPNMPAGLASIIKQQRNRQIQASQRKNEQQQQYSFINQVLDDEQFDNPTKKNRYATSSRFANAPRYERSHTQQIAIGPDQNGPQTERSNTIAPSGSQQNPLLKRTGQVQVQVNLLDDAIEQRSQVLESDEYETGIATQTIDPNQSNFKQKAILSRYKKISRPRKSKYYISQQEDNQESGNQNENNKKNGQRKNDNASQAISRISSSSLSLSSCLVKGLNSGVTQFKKLKGVQKKQQMKGSRVKSTKSNGTFRIPVQDEYVQYLKSYRVLDKKNFNLKQLVKKPLFSIVQQDQGVYFGQYQNNQKVGNGIRVTQKQIFQGQYKNNIKVKGCERNIDGVYKGYFLNGKRQGYGTFQWNNGQKFEGNWKQGVKCGFGIWRSPKGDSYEGQWMNNRQHGEGVFRHKNSTYKGQFQHFLKHGYGQQRFLNGDVYIGYYKQGKPDGKGKYKWFDGTQYQGEFKNGLRSGYGRLSQPNGNVYEGEFLNDFKHGQGKQYDKSGQMFEGIFQKGLILKGYLHQPQTQQITAQYIDNS